jgi:peptidoglycan/LPS O-acetylase OafA/YrhL
MQISDGALGANRPAGTRHQQLDGLRGYAAAAVVVFHSILALDHTQIGRVLGPSLQTLATGYERLTKIALAIFNGEAAVVIFFTMSGAVLLESLRRSDEGAVRLSASFIVKRVLRIYPVLLVCLILAVWILPPFGYPGTLDDFLRNLALIAFPLIGASWTLNVEMLAIPLLLGGALAFRRWGETGLLVFVICALACLKLPGVGRTLTYFSGYAFCFGLGMFIPTRWGARVARATPPWTWPLSLLLLLLAKHIILVGGLNTASTIQQIAAALLVNAVYHQRTGLLGAGLEKRASVFLGRISYTLYLANVLVLEPITQTLLRVDWIKTHPLECGLVVALVVLVISIPLAYLMSVLIEEPAIRLGRRLTQRPSPAAMTGKAAISPSAV